ncbi:hypothetical protein ACT3UQ_08895 [Glutamicibacter sp. AOP12-B1-11]|uniref:hypothetical protein n=1 Tax=Glutamicibacter sp. AOP12-B1-11 TaxID=3457725 RepID=UPI0040334AB2
MTNPQQQADALRKLAAILEADELPGREYQDVPLHVCLYFKNEAQRQSAIFKLKLAGHQLRPSESGKHFSVTIDHDITQTGLEISLIVPTIDHE